MLFLKNCGAGDSSNPENNPNNNINRETSLSSNTLSGGTLVLKPDNIRQSSSESTYKFFSNGKCTYTFESISLSALTVTMQWQIEGNTLYINNGNRFSGQGMKKPQQWQFPKGIKKNAPVISKFSTLYIKSFSQGNNTHSSGGATESTVGKNNLANTVMFYSTGSIAIKDTHILLFYNNGSGQYFDNANIKPYQIQEFSWSSSNGIATINYTDTDLGNSQIEFLDSYQPSNLINISKTILGRVYTTQYKILKIISVDEF